MALIASGVAHGLPQDLGIKESALDGIPQEVADRIRETLGGIDTPEGQLQALDEVLAEPQLTEEFRYLVRVKRAEFEPDIDRKMDLYNSLLEEGDNSGNVLVRGRMLIEFRTAFTLGPAFERLAEAERIMEPLLRVSPSELDLTTLEVLALYADTIRVLGQQSSLVLQTSPDAGELPGDRRAAAHEVALYYAEESLALLEDLAASLQNLEVDGNMGADDGERAAGRTVERVESILTGFATDAEDSIVQYSEKLSSYGSTYDEASALASIEVLKAISLQDGQGGTPTEKSEPDPPVTPELTREQRREELKQRFHARTAQDTEREYGKRAEVQSAEAGNGGKGGFGVRTQKDRHDAEGTGELGTEPGSSRVTLYVLVLAGLGIGLLLCWLVLRRRRMGN